MPGQRHLRTGFALLVATVGALAGCSMCQDTYDDASPVVGSSADAGATAGGRAGSVLNGTLEQPTISESGGGSGTR